MYESEYPIQTSTRVKLEKHTPQAILALFWFNISRILCLKSSSFPAQSILGLSAFSSCFASFPHKLMLSSIPFSSKSSSPEKNSSLSLFLLCLCLFFFFDFLLLFLTFLSLSSSSLATLSSFSNKVPYLLSFLLLLCLFSCFSSAPFPSPNTWWPFWTSTSCLLSKISCILPCLLWSGCNLLCSHFCPWRETWLVRSRSVSWKPISDSLSCKQTKGH